MEIITKINKLIMHGFKSFAKRTELLFGPQFNCILGPNGSGKSNVLDALCFVLGKTSAKSLRAEKASNLIYNGGKTKQPSKNAEVSIFFDNTCKTFPTDDSEIKITRIVKARGNSVYKINDETRTRQQVVELLSLAKINSNGYNVILQGDIVKFVEMHSIERRQLIEEIAGIGVYEEKKHKAMNELNKTEEKLKEAEIILTERNAYLKELKKERNQALKYKDLKDKINTNKATHIYRQMEAKNKVKGEYDKEIGAYQKRMDEANEKIGKLKGEIQEKKKRIEEINAEVERKGEKEQIVLHKEVESLKIGLATNKNSVEALKNEIKRIIIRKEQLLHDLGDLKEKIKRISDEIKENKNQKCLREKELKDIEKRIEEFKKKNNLLSANEIEGNIEKLDKEAEEQQRNILDLRQHQQELFRKKDRLEMQITSIDEKINKIAAVEKENKAQIEDLKQKRTEFKKATVELNQLLTQDTSFASQLLTARQKLVTSNDQLSKLYARNSALQERIFSDKALNEVLKQKNAIKGIYGTVSQLGKVDSKYALAVEIAAGSKIKSIVVDSDVVAAKCIRFLKDKKLGIAKFIPMNKIKVRSEDPAVASYLDYDGVHGKAVSLVKFELKFKKVFDYVFGSAVVVNDINTARRIGIGNMKMVTLDGDVTEISGAMQGGYRQKVRGIGFSQEDVAKDIEKFESERNDSELLIKKLEDTRGTNEEKITKLRQFKASLEGEIITLEKSLNLADGDVDASRKERTIFNKEITNVEKEISKMQNDISNLNKNLAQNKIKKQELRNKITQLRNPRLLAELNAFEQKKTELKEGLIHLDSGIKNQDDQLANIHLPERERIDKIMEQHNQEEVEFKDRIKTLTEMIKQHESELKLKEKDEQKFYQQFKGLFADRSKIDEFISKREKSLESLNESSRKVEINMNKVSLLNAQVKAELAALDSEFEQYRGVRIDHQKSDDHLKREINQFERFVENLGAVNMKALEIYDNVEKEYNNLLGKKERLVIEKQDVLVMMNEIETIKKELFVKTFEVVNEHFKNFFVQLSTKGTANLVLENANDPFEGGLLIKVNMAGKRFMDIRSLSGGEKTMTALAFIFAIQEHDPASFYVMDEVDAALDKKNSDMLAKLVRKYTTRAQYVIISHNDGVIGEADLLYGVSMNEHGQSKVVSLKM